MGQLSNRTYQLIAQDADTGKELEFTELRVAFDFVNTFEGIPNTGNIKIYNTSTSSREILEKVGNSILLKAGYNGENLDAISGKMLKAVTYKSGADIITELEIGDGVFALAGAYVSKVFNQYSTHIDILEETFGAFKSKGVDINYDFDASAFSGILERATTISEPAKDVLDKITKDNGFTWSIQNNELKLLKLDVGSSDSTYILTPTSGLIGSPRKAFTHIAFNILMLPNLKVGSNVEIDSPNTQGTFIIQKMNGVGDTHGGEWGYSCEGLQK